MSPGLFTLRKCGGGMTFPPVQPSGFTRRKDLGEQRSISLPELFLPILRSGFFSFAVTSFHMCFLGFALRRTWSHPCSPSVAIRKCLQCHLLLGSVSFCYMGGKGSSWKVCRQFRRKSYQSSTWIGFADEMPILHCVCHFVNVNPLAVESIGRMYRRCDIYHWVRATLGSEKWSRWGPMQWSNCDSSCWL